MMIYVTFHKDNKCNASTFNFRKIHHLGLRTDQKKESKVDAHISVNFSHTYLNKFCISTSEMQILSAFQRDA